MKPPLRVLERRKRLNERAKEDESGRLELGTIRELQLQLT